MQCVPTIQNSTRNRADFFKSCTRLKDLAQLSKGVFIGKLAFFPGFLPCKNVALPHSFRDHHSHARVALELRCAAFGTNLRTLWHKVAQPLAPRLTNWQAFSGPRVLFFRQNPDPTLAMDASTSGLFRLQERQEATHCSRCGMTARGYPNILLPTFVISLKLALASWSQSATAGYYEIYNKKTSNIVFYHYQDPN